MPKSTPAKASARAAAQSPVETPTPATTPTPVPVSRSVPLSVAALVLLIEGLVLLGFAVAAIARPRADRLGMEISTTVFLGLCGIGLVAAARGLLRAAGWARGAGVLAALISMGLGYDLAGGPWSGGHLFTNLSAVGLFVVALVLLGCLFHPDSTRRFAGVADESAEVEPGATTRRPEYPAKGR